jgi:hypothetical protein
MPVNLMIAILKSVVFHLFDLFNSATYEQWLYLYLNLCFKYNLGSSINFISLLKSRNFVFYQKATGRNSEAAA